MKLSAEKLHAYGQLIFGYYWRAPMALVLGVNERSIRRYAENGMTLNDDQRIRLLKEISARRDRLTDLEEELDLT